MNKFSKIIVISCIATILLFTAVVLLLCANDKSVPDSLIYSFFGVFGIELAALAGIKIKERSNE